MKDKNMSEPFSGAAAGAVGWKLLGGIAGAGAIGAALASIVVMCLTEPRTRREWRVGIICTVVSSIGGGAAAIMHFGLQAWTESLIGLMAMLGLVFACGLPGWALVRWLFNYINNRRDASITDVAREVREVV